MSDRPAVFGWGLAALLALSGGLLAALVLWANPPLDTRAGAPASWQQAVARVRADPLRVPFLRDLGLALDRRGARDEARPLMAFAGERSRRDTAVSLWLMQRALEVDRFDEAFAWADALLRRDIEPDRRDRLYALLTAAAALDPARPALARHLATRPWWRESFLRALAANGDPHAGEATLAALQGTGGAASPNEGQAFLVRRLADRDLAGAVNEARVLYGRAAFDANDLSVPPPVGWSVAEGEGASSAEDGGRLAVSYDGFATTSLPRRLLALSPGTWTVSFEHRTPDAAPPRLAVTIACADGRALGGSPPLAGSPAWRGEALSILVPQNGCPAQWLSITPRPGERRAPTFTDFQKWRVAPGASADQALAAAPAPGM